MHQASAKGTYALLGILLFSLLSHATALLLILRQEPPPIRSRDTWTYERPALAMLRHGTYAINPDSPEVPDLLRPPGYPALIALSRLLLGRHEVPLLVLQGVANAATLLIVFSLARKLWGPRGGVLAAAWLTLDFCTLMFGLRLMTESLYTLMMMLAVAAAVRFLEEERGDHRAAFCFGLFMALAVYLRLVGWYLFHAGLLGMLSVLAWRRVAWRRIVTLALCAALPWVILTGAWRFRTYRLTGEPTFSYALFLHRSVALSLLVHGKGLTIDEALRTLGTLGPHPLLPCTDPRPAAAALRGAGMTLDAFYRHCAEVARTLRRDQPVTFAYSVAFAVVSLMVFPHEGLALKDYFAAPLLREGPLGDLRRLPLRAYLAKWFGANLFRWLAFAGTFLHLWLAYAGIALVVWRLGKGEEEPRALLALLLGVLLYHVLVASTRGVSIDVPRYRAPLMPLLGIYVGALAARRRNQRSAATQPAG